MPSKLIVLLFSLIISSFTLAEDIGSCTEIELKCEGGEQTRKIAGVNVKEPCWQYKYKLDCNKKSLNNCQQIDQNLCVLLEEKCIGHLEGLEDGEKICSNWQRRYSCERESEYEQDSTELKWDGDEINRKVLLCTSMCLDGNCDSVKKAAVEENKELAQSIGFLHALKKIKEKRQLDHGENNFTEDARTTQNIKNIFSGIGMSCTNYIAKFMDCCRENPSGWGEMMALGHCTKDELEISKLRQKKQCIHIESRCTHLFDKFNPFSKCVEKTSSFCCYDSILTRIMIEEAKKQLGRNFGTVKNPDCSGISLDDLDPQDKTKIKVDLSKADYTDFYNSVIIPNINLPSGEGLKEDKKSAENAFKDIETGAKDLPLGSQGFNPLTLNKIGE